MMGGLGNFCRAFDAPRPPSSGAGIDAQVTAGYCTVLCESPIIPYWFCFVGKSRATPKKLRLPCLPLFPSTLSWRPKFSLVEKNKTFGG